MITTRACSGCHQELPADRKDGYCRTCRAEASARWRRENPEAHRASMDRSNERRRGTGRHLRSHLLREYGITLEDYWELVELQSGLCDICLSPPAPAERLHVDHCHSTGRIRGLLCGSCNRALGLLGESSANARRAQLYLSIEEDLDARAA